MENLVVDKKGTSQRRREDSESDRFLSELLMVKEKIALEMIGKRNFGNARYPIIMGVIASYVENIILKS